MVRDAEARQAALDRVAAWLEGEGWIVRETIESPIAGGDGNVEFLLWACRDAASGKEGSAAGENR